MRRDTLYGDVIANDDDLREDYWTVIRNKPDCIMQAMVRCASKHRK